MLVLVLSYFDLDFRLEHTIRDLNYHSSFSCVFSVVPLFLMSKEHLSPPINISYKLQIFFIINS